MRTHVIPRFVAILAALLTITPHWVSGQASQNARVKALVGGTLIDGYGGAPLRNSVIIVDGERIRAVGQVGTLAVPAGAEVISTEGMSVLPGLWDMHVHLMINGHGDYAHWDKTYPPLQESVIMPASAKQLLLAGVTSARDLGGPLGASIAVRDAINGGKIPGPTLYVSGPFIQHEPYPGTDYFRWGVKGEADARDKVRRLAKAGVNVIKMIDQDQMTLEEAKAIVDEAHKLGKTVAAHAHRSDEIRVGLKAGVDCFEHTGLGTKPGYEEDILQGLRDRNATLYWDPTMEPLFLFEYTKQFPERVDDQRLKRDLPPELYRDVHDSIKDVSHLDYFRLVPRRVPMIANKFRQLRESGVTIVVGTDSGIPLNFHFDSTWREVKTMVDLGMAPMDAIRAATYWPAQMLKQPNLGTIAAGKLADVIVIDGDPLTDITSLRNVAHVVKDGKVWK